ncbi:isopenicillin N synthase family dioxygenase [Alteraurantiacibacter buctensis]|uniref:2-oxoglutarate-dependent ethylene/succinate-forming enzyme n=1 Tax=Alteraurantiacibacter buctensis TaxID=1503981 RepID=A0A844YY78_9SPHN|nr:isopenicillin N synthase family oxygenase [Alteraurantiacibacter buctensis]MXO71037.1 isopenicillin N synthase family oxygenase [Alteraurantiacibacter buctensis]
MPTIASVSLVRPLDQVAEELGRSFAETGFGVVRDHGIPADLIDRAWALCREFFALPEEVKRRYHLKGTGGARGYTPFGTEQAKDAQDVDLKEFWHVGRTLPAGDPLERFMAPNVWPAEVPGFRETMEDIYGAFEASGARILQAIAISLGEAPDFFADSVRQGNSVMRLLHYPPLAPGAPEGAIRAAAHEDINTITLLLGAEESGLQLKTADGEWISVAPPEGALVVNIGDMLQRQTNGHLKSTSHRVVNPVGEAARRPRFSMPFFLHFRPDFLIEPMEKFVDSAHSPLPPITAEDYLQQRLREIKLA